MHGTHVPRVTDGRGTPSTSVTHQSRPRAGWAIGLGWDPAPAMGSAPSPWAPCSAPPGSAPTLSPVPPLCRAHGSRMTWPRLPHECSLPGQLHGCCFCFLIECFAHSHPRARNNPHSRLGPAPAEPRLLVPRSSNHRGAVPGHHQPWAPSSSATPGPALLTPLPRRGGEPSSCAHGRADVTGL